MVAVCHDGMAIEVSNLHPEIGTVFVGPVAYHVLEAKDLADGDHTLWGQIDYGAGEILIDPETAPDYRRVLIWHEVLHAILAHAGQKLEEETIQALAYGIVSLIDSNPGNRLLWPGDGNA